MAKHVLSNVSKVKIKLAKDNIILLLDFDLTLSPLAKDPTKAFLPEPTKELLKKLIKLIPVIVVSGRKLSDVKKRVGITGVRYVGNHGLEYNLAKKHETIKVSIHARKALSRVAKELVKMKLKYPGIIFEDKKYSIALGYRMIRSNEVQPLESRFRKMREKIKKEGLLEVRLDKKTFEVRLKTEVNKGTTCLLALQTLQKEFHKKLTPIYIGDSETDEDAFKALQKNGITIRVGRKNKSDARWYLRDQREVKIFLSYLLSVIIK